MDDLISRECAIKAISPLLYSGNFVTTLIHLPAVDAASVVRCKDCKHRPTNNTNIRSCGGLDIEFPDEICPCQCDDGYYNWYPDSDWFCANGEAKDGGEDE